MITYVYIIFIYSLIYTYTSTTQEIYSGSSKPIIQVAAFTIVSSHPEKFWKITTLTIIFFQVENTT